MINVTTLDEFKLKVNTFTEYMQLILFQGYPSTLKSQVLKTPIVLFLYALF